MAAQLIHPADLTPEARRLEEERVTLTTAGKRENHYKKPIELHGGAKYLRKIRPASGTKGSPIQVDVYCVIKAFKITCPALQHALKKILACGERGKGNRLDDMKGVMDAMWRAIELEEEEQEELANQQQQ